MKTNNFYSKHDRITSQLCNEIDDLEQQVVYWREMYEKCNREYNDLMNSSIKHSQQMMGNLLLATLNRTINPNNKK